MNALTFDRMTMIRLRHNVATMPAGNEAYLFGLMWEECRRKMGLTLHTLVPVERLCEVDDATLALLNECGASASRRYHARDNRRFVVNGVEVYCGSGHNGWRQG